MAGRFVIDNSVVMAWCFEDESDAYPHAVLDCLEDSEAVAPGIWPLEVGNILVVAEDKGRLSKAAVAWFLSLLKALPIVVEQENADRALREIVALAASLGVSTYDACYVDLAMRLGLPLATQDVLLTKAARKCGVGIFDPSRGAAKARA